jgi:hypothetical protein
MQRKIVLFLLLTCSLFAVEKVSILIPCHYTHFPLLENLFTAYAHQTVLPDEVVVSLSQHEEIPSSHIDALEQQSWPFKVIVLRHRSKCSAGTNRRLAARASSGDLCLCQDADDLPHPQRVEIVKFIFDHYKVDQLIHSYVPEGKECVSYTTEAIPLLRTDVKILNEGISLPGGEAVPIHHGNSCFSRAALQIGIWDATFQGGEDASFNVRTFHLFRRTSFVTPLRLIIFRTSLSYFSNTPPHLR